MPQPQKLRKRSPHVELTDAELASWKASLNGLSQSAALRRLILWFVAQEDILQGGIIGTLPKSAKYDLARMALDRLAKSP